MEKLICPSTGAELQVPDEYVAHYLSCGYKKEEALEAKTVAELKELAEAKGITGLSKKAELIEALKGA